MAVAEPESLDAAAKVAELQRELERSQALLADLEANHPRKSFVDQECIIARKHACPTEYKDEEYDSAEPQVLAPPAEGTAGERKLKSRLTTWFRGSKPRSGARLENSGRCLSYSRVVLDFSPDVSTKQCTTRHDGGVEPSPVLQRTVSSRQFGSPRVMNSFYSFTYGSGAAAGVESIQPPLSHPELDPSAPDYGPGSESRRFSVDVDDSCRQSRALPTKLSTSLPTKLSTSHRRSTSDTHCWAPAAPACPVASVRFRDSVFTASSVCRDGANCDVPRALTGNATPGLEPQTVELPPLLSGSTSAPGGRGSFNSSRPTAVEYVPVAGNEGHLPMRLGAASAVSSTACLSSSPNGLKAMAVPSAPAACDFTSYDINLMTTPSSNSNSSPAFDWASTPGVIASGLAGSSCSNGGGSFTALARRPLSLRASSFDTATSSKRLSFVDVVDAVASTSRPLQPSLHQHPNHQHPYQPPYLHQHQQQQQQQQQPVWLLSTSPDKSLPGAGTSSHSLHAPHPLTQLAPAAAALTSKSFPALRLTGIPEAGDGGAANDPCGRALSGGSGSGPRTIQPLPALEVELRDRARRKSLCPADVLATGRTGPMLGKSRSSRRQTWGVEAFSGLDEGL